MRARLIATVPAQAVDRARIVGWSVPPDLKLAPPKGKVLVERRPDLTLRGDQLGAMFHELHAAVREWA